MTLIGSLRTDLARVQLDPALEQERLRVQRRTSRTTAVSDQRARDRRGRAGAEKLDRRSRDPGDLDRFEADCRTRVGNDTIRIAASNDEISCVERSSLDEDRARMQSFDQHSVDRRGGRRWAHDDPLAAGVWANAQVF